MGTSLVTSKRLFRKMFSTPPPLYKMKENQTRKNTLFASGVVSCGHCRVGTVPLYRLGSVEWTRVMRRGGGFHFWARFVYISRPSKNVGLQAEDLGSSQAVGGAGFL